MPVSLIPDRLYDRYTDLTPRLLEALHIRLLLCDLDYTLAPRSVERPDKTLRVWLDACREAGVTELPFIVGVDATPPALASMVEGALKGTVQNDAAGQAASILALITALASGQDPAEAVSLTDGTYVWLNYTTVTPENLRGFLLENEET